MRINNITIIKCNKCGEYKRAGNTHGIPNIVGFKKEDRVINLCAECIGRLGRLVEADDDTAIKEFWGALDVSI